MTKKIVFMSIIGVLAFALASVNFVSAAPNYQNTAKNKAAANAAIIKAQAKADALGAKLIMKNAKKKTTKTVKAVKTAKTVKKTAKPAKTNQGK